VDQIETARRTEPPALGFGFVDQGLVMLSSALLRAR
jgi:hypothetical protein